MSVLSKQKKSVQTDTYSFAVSDTTTLNYIKLFSWCFYPKRLTASAFNHEGKLQLDMTIPQLVCTQRQTYTCKCTSTSTLALYQCRQTVGSTALLLCHFSFGSGLSPFQHPHFPVWSHSPLQFTKTHTVCCLHTGGCVQVFLSSDIPGCLQHL